MVREVREGGIVFFLFWSKDRGSKVSKFLQYYVVTAFGGRGKGIIGKERSWEKRRRAGGGVKS